MVTYREINYNPTEVIHPGATLDEFLSGISMTQAELAKRTDRPEKTISEIVNGTASITPETAIQFERALGVPASFWNNLEKNYQEIKAKITAKKQLQTEADMACADTSSSGSAQRPSGQDYICRDGRDSGTVGSDGDCIPVNDTVSV